jgi:SAM-dependent methyltransferase
VHLGTRSRHRRHGHRHEPLFTAQAQSRAVELGVAAQVSFIHGDAAGHVADEKVDVAACIGASWIAGGVAGTIALLVQSLRPGGIILIGEPYWRQLPPSNEVARQCLAHSVADFLTLPELVSSFGNLGHDVVEMVLANPDGWDRYEAAKWLTMRRWLQAKPNDELANEVRAPADHRTRAPRHLHPQIPGLGRVRAHGAVRVWFTPEFVASYAYK